VLTQNCPMALRAVTRRISRIAGAVFAFLAVSFSASPPAVGQSYTRTNVSSCQPMEFQCSSTSANCEVSLKAAGVT
jgi:hypothetical protein